MGYYTLEKYEIARRWPRTRSLSGPVCTAYMRQRPSGRICSFGSCKSHNFKLLETHPNVLDLTYALRARCCRATHSVELLP